MVNVLKQILGNRKGSQAGAPQGLMSFLKQDEKLGWWRPVIIPFRPLVILYNLMLKSRGGMVAKLGSARSQSPQLVSTNEQVYDITRDEFGKIAKIIVHRKMNEV